MMMKYFLRVSFVAFLLGPAPSAVWAKSEPQAVSGTVTGHVQQVGFRAMILKQAIRYNLTGTAQNNANGTVQFGLQGDAKRIQDAVAAIGKGTPKSSDVNVTTFPATINASLNTFTVIGWTSTSRKITKPYDLVFMLRADDKTVSNKEAKAVYHDILKNTLDPDDLKKLQDGDD